MSKIIVDKILIPYTGLERNIKIYLPSTYDNTDISYPVLYMHDGHNLFDKNTSAYGEIWDIQTSLDNFYTETKKAFIVVGIDCDNEGSNRLNEYSPFAFHNVNAEKMTPGLTSEIGGLGKKYVDFLVNDLKPFIDDKFRTKRDRESTLIAGSSMGGLISLYAGLKYPEIYSKVAAFSTAVWFCEKEFLEEVLRHKSEYSTKWYLDVGTNETSNEEYNKFSDEYLNGTINIFNSFKLIGVDSSNIKLIVDEGGIHNEKDWARRFPDAFKFLNE